MVVFVAPEFRWASSPNNGREVSLWLTIDNEGEGNNAKEASSDDNNSDIKISMDDVDPKALAARKGVDDKGKGDSPSLSVDSVELELSDKPEVESSNA